MRRLLKRLGYALALIVLALSLMASLAWWNTERAMARRYVIADAPLVLPTDPDALAAGAHLFRTRGCSDCHGAQGAGRLVLDAPAVVRVVAPNLTPAALAARGYDADAIGAAIRHGVRADGTALAFMPSHDWAELGDADTAALVAHLATLPPSTNDPGRTEVRLLGRVLHLFGRLPLLPAERIDHRPRRREAPAVAATAAYGGYVAGTCAGCHGADFAGRGPVAPDTPPAPALAPPALDAWSEADFFRAMREGRRPDGRELHPIMPWKAFSAMTDVELRALWRYFRSVPGAADRR